MSAAARLALCRGVEEVKDDDVPLLAGDNILIHVQRLEAYARVCAE